MNKNKQLVQLIIMAFLVALGAILTKVTSVMLLGGMIRFGIGALPVLFAGLMLGSYRGAIVGILADLLGVLLFPSPFAFHIGFTISGALTGLIPGLFAKVFKEKDSLFVIITSVTVVFVLVWVGLNTIWVSQLFGKAYVGLLPARVLSSALIAVANILLLLPLCKAMKKLPLFSSEHKTDLAT